MLIFRNATEEDMESIATLEEQTFADAWTVRSLFETFAQKQAFVTVAEADSVLVGYCIIYYVINEGEIARIAVNKKYRCQGVGNRLLDYTCKCCLERQVERLLLDVRESNKVARTFYERYGFTEDGVRKNFYDNPREDAILMSKNIE